MDVPEEDMHNDIDDKASADDNIVQPLVEEAEEVGVVHMDDIDNVHPEDVLTVTLPPTSKISGNNIHPDGSDDATSHPITSQMRDITYLM